MTNHHTSCPGCGAPHEPACRYCGRGDGPRPRLIEPSLMPYLGMPDGMVMCRGNTKTRDEVIAAMVRNGSTRSDAKRALDMYAIAPPRKPLWLDSILSAFSGRI